MAHRIQLDGVETLDDILANDLAVLFVGYNPSLLAVEAGHYYPRKANRFWEDLHEAGFVPRILRDPGDDLLLPSFGIGVTDLVKRPSSNADGLTPDEYAAGVRRLEGLIRTHRPRLVCFNGLGLLAQWKRYKGDSGGVEVLAVPSTSPRNQGRRVERLEAFKALRARL